VVIISLIFIHSELAIQLAQWISPTFALQVSYWIKTLFTQRKVKVNIKVLKEKENLINDYKKRNEYFEKAFLKRHSIKNLDDGNNIVYLVTCDELEVNKKYIICKAKGLLNRLSQYNKMSEFKVIYSITLTNEDNMEFAELIVLNSL
jgi:hypothetical protein